MRFWRGGEWAGEGGGGGRWRLEKPRSGLVGLRGGGGGV